MRRTKKGRALNWHHRLPHMECFPLSMAIRGVPEVVDLRSKDTPIFDQGTEGSCTANAGCGLYDFLAKQHNNDIITSRNYCYYQERLIDGDTDQDAGSSLATCSDVFLTNGVCTEALWPYGTTTLFQSPDDAATANAQNQKIAKRIYLNQDIQTFAACLAMGSPFMGGLSIYDTFEDAPNGDVPDPISTDQYMGGHALCFVGYDAKTKRILGRNSWGTAWGNQGYFTISFDYICNPNLASDFWAFQL